MKDRIAILNEHHPLAPSYNDLIKQEKTKTPQKDVTHPSSSITSSSEY